MKTKLKAIVCAAAAALSVGTASLTIANASLTRSDKEAAYDAAVALREDPEWIEAFQQALLEGKSPIDPVHAVIIGTDMTEGYDEIMPAYLEQAAPASMDATDVKLTLVHDDQGGTGYNLWSGRFVVNDVEAFASSFSEPLTMNCIIYGNSTRGRLDYKTGYSVNYKKLTGQYYYMENGQKTGYNKTVDGTTYIFDVTSAYSGSGKIIEKAFYFYMYRGDSEAPYYDVAVVHVVDKDYAATAEYAALPYGNLIDCYTYVDVNELPEVVFEEN